MRATIYQLRHEGAKLRDIDWQKRPVGPGELAIIYRTARGSDAFSTKALTMHALNPVGGVGEELVGCLYEADLVGMTGTRIRLRGIQVTQDGRSVVQEWLCELV